MPNTKSKDNSDTQAATASYRPVYHFQDKHLLDVFLRGIPRPALIDAFRNSESLRNRYFRGFRVSSIPLQQLIAAYRGEIIDHRNGELASLVCAVWISQHSQLTATALESLGITGVEPVKVHSWIAAVHAKLTSDEYNVRPLVRTLARQFIDDEVQIFISIIGYNADQEKLRNTVEDELQRMTSDPYVMKERLEYELRSSEAILKATEESRSEICAQEHNEITSIQAELNELLAEHDQVLPQLSADDAAVQAVAKQLADLRVILNERQHTRDAKKNRVKQLSKSIDRQRKQLAATQESYGKRRQELERRIEEQSQRIATLTREIEQAAETIRLQQQQRTVEQSCGEEWKATADHKQSEEHREPHEETQSRILGTLKESPAIAESPQSLGLVGDNAICYQGIQRTFRNTVVQFLRERLPRVYPNDHIERMKKPFSREWEQAAHNAIQSRQILGTKTTIRDDYDLLGTNHFYGLFDAFYDKLFSEEAGQPKNTPKPVKARFLGNLKAIKDGRDPLAHPVEEEIEFEEAHHLLISAKQVLSIDMVRMRDSRGGTLRARSTA